MCVRLHTEVAAGAKEGVTRASQNQATTGKCWVFARTGISTVRTDCLRAAIESSEAYAVHRRAETAEPLWQRRIAHPLPLANAWASRERAARTFFVRATL